ncbi:MAG: hypothetical protein WA958_10205 [Tunicatimonas sp.]
MKNLFFALFAMTFLFASASFAQEVSEPTEEVPPTDEVTPQDEPTLDEEISSEIEQPADDYTASAEGQEVQFEQLPEAVKNAFEGSDYALWQVQTVTELAPAEGTEAKMYEFDVTDGTTEETVTFNEDGEQQ